MEAGIWRSVMRAIQAVPEDVSELKGASGLSHPMLAVGVDDSRRRLILVSGEHDARAAAFAQVDIQAAAPDLSVVVTRPLAVDLASAASHLADMIGSPVLDIVELVGDQTDQEEMQARLTPYLEPIFQPLMAAFGSGRADFAQTMMQFIQQLSMIQVNLPKQAELDEPSDADSNDATTEVEPVAGMTFNLETLADFNPIAQDLDLGLCPFPLFVFSEDELSLMASEESDDAVVRAILSSHNVVQYFRPPADHLALGLVEREALTASELVEHLSTVPNLGHPFGSMEVVDQGLSLLSVVDELQKRKLLVSGEVSLELGEDGERVRSAVRFSPREGLISKLVNRLNVNVDLTTRFFGPQ